jgi:hypothetical protein
MGTENEDIFKEIEKSVIEHLIRSVLFEQVGNPDELEKQYTEQIILKDKFIFNRGNEWITEEGRYIFQEERTYLPSRKIKMTFIPNIPDHFLQFRQYTEHKRAELKQGISPETLSQKLASEINSYLLIPKMVEEYADSISKGLEIGIPPQAKHREKMITEGLGWISLNKKRKKDKLILSLYSILSEHTRNIDNEHLPMGFFYVGLTLKACFIEEGEISQIQHRLYKKYRALID